MIHKSTTAVIGILTVVLLFGLPSARSEEPPDVAGESPAREATVEFGNVSPDTYADFCMGIDAIERNQFEEAVSWFERAAALDPQSTDCYFWIGALCDERLGQPAKAREHFEKALRLSPGNFQARYGLAKQVLRSGRFDEAMDAMRPAFESAQAADNPELAARAYMDFGRAAEVVGRRALAVELYTHAAELSSQPVYPLIRLAYLYRQMNQREKAADVFQQVQEMVPTYADIYRELATEYEAIGSWAQALDALQIYMHHRDSPGETNALLKQAAGLAEKAGDQELSRTLRQKCFLQLQSEYKPESPDAGLCEEIADTLIELDDAAQAKTYMEKAVAAADEGDRARLWFKLAAIFDKLGDKEQALTLLHDSIGKVEPRVSIQFRSYLAQILVSMGRTDEAEQALKAILDIPGARAAGHAELGASCSRRGDFEGAIRHLQQAIDLGDRQESLRYRIQLGGIYGDAGRPEDAEKLLSASLDLFPDNAALSNALGWFYAERGRNLDRALALTEAALKIDPRNPYYLDTLGWVYFKQGRTEDALQQLLKAAALVNEGAIWDHLGDVYMKLGQPQKASYHWERSLQFDPQLKGVREKIEQLQP